MSQITEFLQRRVDGRLAVPALEIAPILGFSIQTLTTRHAKGLPTIPNRLSCGKLTLITAKHPANLGKTFKLTASGLEKRTAGQMVEGSFEVREFADVEALAELLAKVGNDQAIMASLPSDERESGQLVTKAEKHKHPSALARTKEDFHFPANQPGLMGVDYDPPPGATPFTRDQLWALLRSVVPGLESASVLWWGSGSSFIYQGEEQIQGLKGQRLYILVQDLADTVRAGDILFKRLWLTGQGRFEISASGSLLARSIIDMAMFQPARLDFIGGAVCEPPLEQRRGLPVVLSNGGLLDTSVALSDLTTHDQAKYEDLVDAARAQSAPEAEKVKAQWQSDRLPTMVEWLVKSGVPADQAKDRAERTLSTALRGVLLGDFAVTLADGKTVTVGQILDDRAKYHCILTRDPIEPGYLGNKVCGKLYLFGSVPVLTSRAHGGQSFRLLRQPGRLYVQKGSKAQLVDQIIEMLDQEPDLFLRGGALVRVENGEVRPLRKHALTHTIQTRIAFFSRNTKGNDLPVDLPSDVIDMVLAVMEH